jgi:photosystem II stability/assembly factor-like uncharacterized protein
VVVKTADGGKTWETISPDLSRETYDLPASVASYADAAKSQATRRGVVYSHRTIAAGRQRTLGGHRRRSHPTHARRR